MSRSSRTCLLFFLLFCFCVSGISLALAAPVDKLSSDLRLMINEGSAKTPAAANAEVPGGGVLRILARATCPVSTLQNAGMNVVAQVGDIFTGTIAPASLVGLASLPEVISIKTPALLRSNLTVAVPAVNGEKVKSGVAGGYAGFTGKDVIVGIIDTGIDVNHQDFKNPDGSSRILYIWDQTLDGTPPSDYTFGTEWTKADIDAGRCTHRDIEGHGTLVTGIAAGNGRATGNGYPANRYMGMAPEADIIVVAAEEPGFGFFEDRIINGINYIQSKAAALGKPVVINLSLGTQDSAHDGTSFLDRAIDAASGPGKIFVISAGNDGNNDPVGQPHPSFHAQGKLTANGATDIVTIQIPADQCRNSGALNDFLPIVMWYETGDAFLVRVTSPNGYSAEASTGQINPESTRSTADGYIYIDNASGGPDPNNSDNEARINIEDFTETNAQGSYLPIGGEWTITVIAQKSSQYGTYDMWIPGGQFCSRVNQTGFASSTSNFNVFNTKLVASPGSATTALTVGAFVSRNTWTDVNGNIIGKLEDQVGQIAYFSSPGPTRDNRTKPEISAPGQNIASALVGPPERNFIYPAEQIVGDGEHVISRGTSFSAPMLTGLVALMMQNNVIKTGGVSNLQSFQVRSWIETSAVADQFTGAVPTFAWGWGKLDALAAMGKNPPNGPILSVKNDTSTSIALSWTITPPATRVIVERKTGENGTFEQVATVPGGTSYLDAGLTKDTFYGYRVTAQFGELNSSPSNEEGVVAKSSGGGGGGGCFIKTILH